ncbi:MAG: hypothetical protein U0174_12935 [Polyangiaceae bacterium]
MNAHDDAREPMDDEMEALLASARVIDAPSEAKDRLRARLQASLPGGGGGGGDGHSATGHTQPATAPVAVAGFRAPLWLLAAATVGAGCVGFGAAVLLMRSAPAERVIYIEKPTPVVPTSVTTFASSADPSLTAVDVGKLPRAALAASAPPPSVTSTASASNVSDLAQEREVLVIARTALGRGDGPNALVATTRHEKAFPNGVLREEREAIAIQALVLSGRSAEAHARAARFKRAFPQSLLLPTVEAAVGTSP